MRIVFVCAIVAGLLSAGCAVRPELIASAPVTQARFAGMSCEDLRLELELVTQRINTLSDRQRANRARDGWLNAVLPGLGAATPDQENAIAVSKGELEAIQRAHVRCVRDEGVTALTSIL